ncbi:MAG TPA: indole-3-glycerol phosphate synthase TrpC [Polyangia bacterium]|jgi:indole-3-glycerol phosphate synthase|nr:indole-3-glycerol phosphate synthase TrpC [Polyangia bacterium]
MILDDILARTRADLAARKAKKPLSDLEKGLPTGPTARSLAKALRPGRPGEQVTCIAEFKRRSPSAGWIREGAKPAEVARLYAAAGAAALSVLTDEPFFGGTLDDLTTAHAATTLPVMRKDFIVDAYQLAEARVAGADAALLIVAALTDSEMSALLAVGQLYGLELLVEAHDAEEARRAVAAGARVIGINNRDLKTFTVDRDLAVRLRGEIPTERILVAESGIRDAADVKRLRDAGVDAMLVGETLMRAEDPGATLRALLAAPS